MLLCFFLLECRELWCSGKTAQPVFTPCYQNRSFYVEWGSSCAWLAFSIILMILSQKGQNGACWGECGRPVTASWTSRSLLILFHLVQKRHSQSGLLCLSTGSEVAYDKKINNAEFTWIFPLGDETDADWKVGAKEVMIVSGAIVNHNTHYSQGPCTTRHGESRVSPETLDPLNNIWKCRLYFCFCPRPALRVGAWMRIYEGRVANESIRVSKTKTFYTVQACLQCSYDIFG